MFLQTFAEPVDYVITAYDIYQDPDDLWNYAGFIPFIPGSMKHVGKKIEIPQVNAQNGNEFRDHVADLLQDYLDDMFPDAVVTVRKEVAKTDPRWGTRVMDIDVEIDHVDGSFSNFGIETKFSIHGEDTARSLYPSSHTNSQGWTQAQIDEILMLENDYVVTPVFGGP